MHIIVTIALLIVYSKLDCFVAETREFIAMRVSAPVYTATPRHHAVLRKIDPRIKHKEGSTEVL